MIIAPATRWNARSRETIATKPAHGWSSRSGHVTHGLRSAPRLPYTRRSPPVLAAAAKAATSPSGERAITPATIASASNIAGTRRVTSFDGRQRMLTSNAITATAVEANATRASAIANPSAPPIDPPMPAYTQPRHSRVRLPILTTSPA
ncbi:MAG TPA: hypothetical protein VGG28_34710 [Kofleriaceae bacterium]